MNPILSFLDLHAHLLGWPTGLLAIWKVSRYFSKLETRAQKAEETVQLLATNHLPHLQAAIDGIAVSMDKGLDRLDQSLERFGTNLLLIATAKK